jgi:hypothetical protein
VTRIQARRWRVAAVVATGACVVAATTVNASPAPRSAGVTKLVAASSGSQVTLSGWATFSGAVIASGTSAVGNTSDPAAGSSGADLIGADVVYRPELGDLFIRWQVASSCSNCGIPSVGAAPAQLVGDPTVLYGLRTTVAGTPIEIRVQSAGASWQFGLFTCQAETSCTPSQTLQGGFGTTGEEIVTDLPFSTLAAAGLKIKEGDSISTPIAFTARAPYAAGVVVPQLYDDSIVTGKGAKIQVPVKSVRVTAGSVTKTATLNNGYFNVSFPRSSLPRGKTTTVKTTTCLGSSCVVQKFPVKS